MTEIGNFAFKGCTSLDKVIIPNRVITIGEQAFGYYDNFREIKKLENFTIQGDTDSEAQIYANENGFTFVASDQTPPLSKGDVNGDGKVSVADARSLIVAIAKNDTAELLEFGDVNGDGKISVADARKIVVSIAKG